jgi:hypothetical protein
VGRVLEEEAQLVVVAAPIEEAVVLVVAADPAAEEAEVPRLVRLLGMQAEAVEQEAVADVLVLAEERVALVPVATDDARFEPARD